VIRCQRGKRGKRGAGDVMAPAEGDMWDGLQDRGREGARTGLRRDINERALSSEQSVERWNRVCAVCGYLSVRSDGNGKVITGRDEGGMRGRQPRRGHNETAERN
jgi:hypothetical protein